MNTGSVRSVKYVRSPHNSTSLGLKFYKTQGNNGMKKIHSNKFVVQQQDKSCPFPRCGKCLVHLPGTNSQRITLLDRPNYIRVYLVESPEADSVKYLCNAIISLCLIKFQPQWGRIMLRLHIYMSYTSCIL